ncbi:salivary glue protein Sgs-3-like [Mytilus californianus]|uniref:salivary glue protein Sgs-3-like n=1 Tax=Mytilus californianus TaxID=6549 RepID=UPI0022450FE7|nr:salivary glue protein Sgs-3-like [Mytilus californianus]
MNDSERCTADLISGKDNGQMNDCEGGTADQPSTNIQQIGGTSTNSPCKSTTRLQQVSTRKPTSSSHLTTPQTSSSRPTTPQTSSSRPTTPQTSSSHPTTPQTSSSHPTTPQTSSSHPTTPQTSSSHPTTPQTSSSHPSILRQPIQQHL